MEDIRYIYHKIKVTDPTQKVTGTTHFNIKRPEREAELYTVLTYGIQEELNIKVEIISGDGQILVRAVDRQGEVRNFIL